MYFLGVTEGLRGWRGALAPGGAVAFSQGVYLGGDEPQAVCDFWAGEPGLPDRAALREQVGVAGFEVIATRLLTGGPWEAYYDSLAREAAALRPGATREMAAVLDGAERETAMGFCLLGNVAAAAKHALDHHGHVRCRDGDSQRHRIVIYIDVHVMARVRGCGPQRQGVGSRDGACGGACVQHHILAVCTDLDVIGVPPLCLGLLPHHVY